MIVWINSEQLNGETSDLLKQMMLLLIEPETKFEMKCQETLRCEEKANKAL